MEERLARLHEHKAPLHAFAAETVAALKAP
jgi:hypothetical protein